MKIKITLPIGILAIMITSCFASCGGTLEEPFLVDSPETLLKVGTGKDGWGLDKHYKQTSDIDMTGQEWTPIGATYKKSFTGSFDGNGYTITELTIESYEDNHGMFGYIGEGGIVKNIALINNSISGAEDVGGLVGYNSGTVKNCYSTGSISGAIGVGGLVGYNSGTVQSCYTTGNVTGDHMFAGGLVGYNSKKGIVKNCYSLGNIGEERFVGGVVGRNKGIVQNCYATGKISGWDSDPVGGVVGDSNEGYRVHGCVGLNPSIIRVAYRDIPGNQFGRVVGDNYQCRLRKKCV